MPMREDASDEVMGAESARKPSGLQPEISAFCRHRERSVTFFVGAGAEQPTPSI
jgi:hypothetical protein